MAQPLSDRQLDHLQALLNKERGAYPGLNMGTLAALEKRGFVSATRGVGSIAMPHTAIKWRLTSAGKHELAKIIGMPVGPHKTED